MMYNTETTSEPIEALSVDGAQPVWLTLNEARERNFTGELVFEGDPDVFAYLDHGIVYYAEESGTEPLGQRLVAAGLLDGDQLERGTVRIGDTEHLGRLFDRDPSIDRDAVLVMTEAATEDLITRLANEAVATVRITAYRHHPSGLHRWFVVPAEIAPTQQPFGAASPLGAGVLEDLPGAGHSMDDLVDELTIEWDEPFDGLDAVEVLAPLDDGLDDVVVDESAPSGPSAVEDDADVEDAQADDGQSDDDAAFGLLAVEHDLVIEADDEGPADEAPIAPFDMADFVDLDLEQVEQDDEAEVVAVDEATVGDLPVEDVPVDHGVFDQDDEADGEGFEMIWPDGGVEVASSAEDLTGFDEEPAEAAFAEETDGDGVEEIHFEIPELVVGDDDDVATDEVSDDVADAVRRALTAIETASLDVAPASPVSDPVLSDETAPALTDEATPMAFAPPTPDMSAEAIYARAAEAATSAPTMPSPEPGQPPAASTGDDGNERVSALRRLIRGLGRKDR